MAADMAAGTGGVSECGPSLHVYPGGCLGSGEWPGTGCRQVRPHSLAAALPGDAPARPLT